MLDAENIVAVERVDAVLDGAELGMSLAEELQSLAPFGRGNPTVSLMLAEATFADTHRWAKAKKMEPAAWTVYPRVRRLRPLRRRRVTRIT